MPKTNTLGIRVSCEKKNTYVRRAMRTILTQHSMAAHKDILSLCFLNCALSFLYFFIPTVSILLCVHEQKQVFHHFSAWIRSEHMFCQIAQYSITQSARPSIFFYGYIPIFFLFLRWENWEQTRKKKITGVEEITIMIYPHDRGKDTARRVYPWSTGAARCVPPTDQCIRA